MAKAKKAKTNNKQTSPRRRNANPRAGALLDKPAADLARLLADPCGAPVVHSISPGSGGSFVVRVEADAIIFSGAAQTAGIFYWAPGGIRAFANAGPDDVTALTLNQITNLVPGDGFLASYSSAKCVAACAQVMFPGTELQRSGVVGMGVVPVATLSNVTPVAFGGSASTTTAANIRTLCQICERTPDITQEIRWRPGQGDEEDVDLNALNQTTSIFVTQARGRNAIVISAAGLPAAVGIRIRTVAVYEITPRSGFGLMASVETTRSSSTITQVLQALDKASEGWWHGPVGYGVRNLASLAANYVAGPTGGALARAALGVGMNPVRGLIKG